MAIDHSKKQPGSLELLIATGNVGKAAEISAALADLPITFRSLHGFHNVQTVAEDGKRYEENALLKARGYARQTGLCALADDSGLEVEALGGLPGILSARYAGAEASDADRIALLLERMAASPDGSRKARFVCVIAVCDSASETITVAPGVCEGTIVDAPRGHNGFGYDPIFVPEGFNETFAELPSSVKNRISHRGKALSVAHRSLAEFLTKQSTVP